MEAIGNWEIIRGSMKLRNNTTFFWVMVAIGLACVVGHFSQGHEALKAGYQLLGQLFLNALTLMVIPLVASSVIAGIGGLGAQRGLGRLGAKTFFYYVLTVLIAAVVGLAVVTVLPFGVMEAGSAAGQLPAAPEDLFKQVLFKIVPSNVFAAASQGNMLGVIVFSLLFGIALSGLEVREGMVKFWQSFFAVMMRMTQVVMKALPVGVFFLVASAVAHSGLGAIASALWFVVAVLLGLGIFLFGVIPCLLVARGVSVRGFFRAIFPALVTAFSTSSSAASLPITLECVEKRAGVSNRVASFVVPLGTSFNMTGSALYECVGVLFIAAMSGIELHFVQQVMVVGLSLIAAMGLTGIPSASLIAIMVILNTLGLPPEGIAFIIPVERILDMFRTVINVASEAACAVMVARWEGEKVLS